MVNASSINSASCGRSEWCCANLVKDSSEKTPRKTVQGETLRGDFHYQRKNTEIVGVKPDAVNLWIVRDDGTNDYKVEPDWWDVDHTGFSHKATGVSFMRLCANWNGHNADGKLIDDWIRGEYIWKIDFGPV